MSLDPTAFPFWPQPGDHIVQRAVERHLGEILTVVADRDRRAEPQLARLRRMLAQERPHQRGLAGPVAADDAEHAGPLHRAAEPLDQGAWRRADPHAPV